ncbi:hypothetical protein Bcop_1696 [Bacteroides coprosuis DSM 18011]|uniref:Uncharacterized protein n=1 Tax=Bacteroides coprosuis DSM 18011 TaxID=679937 RepID=F3ZR15_9BACE|nr:hypothetical protein [Bacteroides coprosuis]EGJ71888.1 hypothetical protein Bcop_1696 [Bacteroides coprosuis DSM 18011]
MKKLVLTVALFFGLGTVATYAQQEVKEQAVQEVVQDEFVKIEISELPEAVVNTIKKITKKAQFKKHMSLKNMELKLTR